MKHLLLIFALLISASAYAGDEYSQYGYVQLNGLAKYSWRGGPEQAMVCNVNGDRFLTVRSCASSSCASVRKFDRLAIFVVDTSYRSGSWVLVRNVYRDHNADGYPQNYVQYGTQGWAHTSYLCNFNY